MVRKSPQREKSKQDLLSKFLEFVFLVSRPATKNRNFTRWMGKSSKNLYEQTHDDAVGWDGIGFSSVCMAVSYVDILSILSNHVP